MNYTGWLIIAVIVVLILALLIIPRFMMKRALKEVIAAFRTHRATSAANARTQEELGLQPRTLTERMYKSRDYKPYVLDHIEKAGIIMTTDDGKLYLLEDKLPENLRNPES